MKNTLPRLWTAVQLVASAAIALSGLFAPTQAAHGADTSATTTSAPAALSGDRLLVQALNQLERRRSVTARLNYDVWLLGERLSGRGSYWQQGSGEELRVRLEMQMIGQDASLLQVSNGRALWIDRRLPIGRTVSQINLRHLRSDPVLAADNFDRIRPGEASWSPTQPDLLACYGGLPRIIASLSDNFSFMPRQAMRLVSPGSPPQASIPYFAVVGHWKPEKLAMISGGATTFDSLGPEGGGAQSRLPQEVLLLFGQADLFPYDVAFDVPIAVGQFDYAPGDVDWVDQTADVLERLHRERQAKVATRSMEPPPAAPSR
jgi:hypothetical protein